MRPSRVFHIDDSSACRRLVTLWLARHEDVEHVGELSSVADDLRALAQANPDVVLLDTMGATGDIGAAARIRAAAPHARLVLYSGFVGIAPPDTLEIGADAYLRKEATDESLVALVRELRDPSTRSARFSASRSLESRAL